MKSPISPFRITLICLFLLMASASYTQEYVRQIDSLKLAFEQAKYDSTRGRLLDDISYIYYSYHLDSSIAYAQKSGDYGRKCGDKGLVAQSYNSIGVCLVNKAALMSAMENFDRAYEIYHSIDDKRGEAKMVNNLGVIYTEIGEYAKAIEKYKLSYAINSELKLWDIASSALFNIALNEIYLKNFDLALTHANELQLLRSKYPNAIHPAPLYADIFQHNNMLDSARFYAELAVNDHVARGETYLTISSRVILAEIQLKLGDIETAGKLIRYCDEQIEINNYTDSKIKLLPLKAKYLSLIGSFEEAFKAQSEYVALKDSVDKANRMNIINDLNARYETGRMENEIAEQDEQLAENKTWLTAFFLIACILTLGLAAVAIFLKKNKRLNRLLKTQNAHINIQRQKIISSITYAKKIQQSTLPKETDFLSLFKESFIYFKPKDIISGDFYAYQIIDSKTYIAAIDCTGHGVPGAFMSLIANSKLNRVVNEFQERDPGRILASMHREIQHALQQENNIDNAQDGLEMSICVIDRAINTIQFAGAGSSIMMMHNNELKEYKGAPLGIGGNMPISALSGRNLNFQTQSIPFSENDMLLMYSDGFHDQIGGADNKKLNKSKFRDFVQELYRNNLLKATEYSERFINTWRKNQPQTDDIMLIGIRL